MGYSGSAVRIRVRIRFRVSSGLGLELGLDSVHGSTISHKMKYFPFTYLVLFIVSSCLTDCHYVRGPNHQLNTCIPSVKLSKRKFSLLLRMTYVMAYNLYMHVSIEIQKHSFYPIRLQIYIFLFWYLNSHGILFIIFSINLLKFSLS